MKKISILLVMLLVCFCLGGCGEEKNPAIEMDKKYGGVAEGRIFAFASNFEMISAKDSEAKQKFLIEGKKLVADLTALKNELDKEKKPKDEAMSDLIYSSKFFLDTCIKTVNNAVLKTSEYSGGLLGAIFFDYINSNQDYNYALYQYQSNLNLSSKHNTALPYIGEIATYPYQGLGKRMWIGENQAAGVVIADFLYGTNKVNSYILTFDNIGDKPLQLSHLKFSLLAGGKEYAESTPDNDAAVFFYNRNAQYYDTKILENDTINPGEKAVVIVSFKIADFEIAHDTIQRIQIIDGRSNKIIDSLCPATTRPMRGHI